MRRAYFMRHAWLRHSVASQTAAKDAAPAQSACGHLYNTALPAAELEDHDGNDMG
jgi:hypothetical protein